MCQFWHLADHPDHLDYPIIPDHLDYADHLNNMDHLEHLDLLDPLDYLEHPHHLGHPDHPTLTTLITWNTWTTWTKNEKNSNGKSHEQFPYFLWLPPQVYKTKFYNNHSLMFNLVKFIFLNSLTWQKPRTLWQILLKSIFGLAIYSIQTPSADCKNMVGGSQNYFQTCLLIQNREAKHPLPCDYFINLQKQVVCFFSGIAHQYWSAVFKFLERKRRKCVHTSFLSLLWTFEERVGIFTVAWMLMNIYWGA